MVTLRSLQKKRGLRNIRSKRVRTQRLRGGRPNRDSPRSLSLSRTYSPDTMRAFTSLPVLTATPRPSETEEQRKTREKKENQNRQNFRKAMQRLFTDLKKTVKDKYVGPPHFRVKKLWTDKWTEIMNEMDSMANTLAVLRGEPDTFYTKKGTMGYKMNELKEIHEQYMTKDSSSTGASKKTKKKGRKKTKGKKKKKTKGMRQIREKKRTLLSYLF